MEAPGVALNGVYVLASGSRRVGVGLPPLYFGAHSVSYFYLFHFPLDRLYISLIYRACGNP